MKTAVRGLAEGAKGYEKYPKLMAEKFVFLNVYCQSVEDEHKPRGPEGPYQFNDKSVPVCVVKLWDGETVVQQLGFASDPKQNLRTVSGWMDKGLKKNGPILPPKKLRPLAKSFDKGEAYLKKKRPGYAWKEFEKVRKLGDDKKKFPDGPPSIAAKAKEKADAIKKELETAIAEAMALGEDRAKETKKRLSALQRSYGTAKELKQLINDAKKLL